MEPFDISSWGKNQSPVGIFIDGVTIDSRTIPSKNSLFVALPGKRGHGHNYVEDALSRGAVFALVESEWPAPQSVNETRLIRVASPLLALQDLARCYRSSFSDLEVVAVAGSCGKTMLKDLLSHIFQEEDIYFSPESFNSQIGVALSLLNIPKGTRLAFIEMAATERGEMARHILMAHPKYALITNFYRHRLGSQEMKACVVQELFDLLASLPETGFAVIEKTSIPQCSCSIHFWNEHKTHPNFLAELFSIASKTALLFKKPQEEIDAALTTYYPELMRTEIWKNGCGTTFMNLPYSKTPLSFTASLDETRAFETVTKPSSQGKKFFFFEGLRKEEETRIFSEKLCTTISQHGITDVVCWKKGILEAFSKHSNNSFSLHFFPSLKEAIAAFKKTFGPHDTVLFKGEHTFSLNRLMEHIDDTVPHTRACINLAAISSNLELLKKHLPQKTRIMVMVKALAYGTDDYRISHYLRSCGIEILGVSYVDEGVRLRQQGDSQPIFVLHAAENEIKKALLWDLEIGVSTKEQLDAAKEATHELKGRPLKIHLHVDTGMKRFGCQPEEALILARELAKSKNLVFEGVFTHFAVADDPTHDAFTEAQANILHKILVQLEAEHISPQYSHACNSAGAIRFSFPFFNMVRLGLATYGFHPSEACSKVLGLRPALSLVSTIVGFTEGSKGDTVSYGRTHVVTTTKARFAMLPIGYYDGLHRSYSGKASVRIRGKEAPVVGRICMDYTMVDVSEIPEATVGDTALFFGEDENGTYISPADLAATGGSITHELMACLGPRIQRLFIYDESSVPKQDRHLGQPNHTLPQL